LGLAVALTACCLGVTPARAEAPVAANHVEGPMRVALVGSGHPSSGVAQGLTLLRGELLSLGFDVSVLERPSAEVVRDGAGEPRAWLEPLVARGVSAAVEAFGAESLEGVDIWLLTGAPPFEILRIGAQPQETGRPEMLALRAVEALRARLLEGRGTPRPPSEAPVTAELPLSPSAPAPARRRAADVSVVAASPPAASSDAGKGGVIGHVGMEAGAGAVMSFDGLGPAILPTVRGAWAASPWLVLLVSAAGGGTASKVATSVAAARVRQQQVLVGGRTRWRSDARVSPFVGLAVGIVRTSVEGEPAPGLGAHEATRWSGLLDLSAGSYLRLSRRLYVALGLHAQIAAPYVAVSLLGETAANVGRPNILLTLALGMWP
jgi:hypothetical protein